MRHVQHCVLPLLYVTTAVNKPSALNPSPEWSRTAKILHLLLALLVTLQLFVGSFMRSPHARQPDSFGFISHEILGAAIVCVLIAFWCWACARPEAGVRHLFPWNRAGRRQVASDLRALLGRRQLPAGGPQDRGLAGLVHGLGMLTVSALGVVGASFFFARLAGASWGTLNLIEDAHDVFAALLWAYWGGHLAMVLLHTGLGHPVWQSIFRFSRAATRKTREMQRR